MDQVARDSTNTVLDAKRLIGEKRTAEIAQSDIQL